MHRDIGVHESDKQRPYNYLGYGARNGVNWHCPICKKPTDSDKDAEFPFCSERCRLVDLGNWASERYLVSEPVHDEPVQGRPVLDESTPEAPPADESKH